MLSHPVSISELPDINQGMQKSKYEQVSASRDITGANFSNGSQNFRFSVTGTKHWLPSKTFLRMRVQYVAAGGVSPDPEEYSASPFVLSNLYTGCEMRVADRTLNKIDQYVPQITAFKQRITKGGYWLNTVGNAQNASSVHNSDRSEVIVAETGEAAAIYSEFMWQPPLACFDVSSFASGQYELVLNPVSSSEVKLAAILSKEPGKVPGVNFDVIIKDVYLYVATIEGPENISSLTYALDMENYQCVSDKITSADSSMKFFDVSPSTVSLAVAYQDTRSLNFSNMSPSLFHVLSTAGDDEWGQGKLERNLREFYISYASQQKPSPTGQFDGTNNKYKFLQRYIENQLECELYETNGGGESYEDWVKRGLLLLYSFEKAGDDAATRVQVVQSFAPGTDTDNMRILLFSISRTSAEITVTNGAVSNLTIKER